MLQVGVDDGKVGRAARQHAFDHGRRKSAAADALQATHARIGLRQRAHRGRRAVWRVVVDKHDFPFNAGQRPVEPRQKQRDVVALIEGWNDDRQLDTRLRRRLARGYGGKLRRFCFDQRLGHRGTPTSTWTE